MDINNILYLFRMVGREKFISERPTVSSKAVVRKRFPSHSRSRSRSHSRSRLRSRSRSRSKSRSRSNLRGRSKSRSQSRNYQRSRSRSYTRGRSCTKGSKNRSRSPSRRRSVSVQDRSGNLDTHTFKTIIQKQQQKIEELLCSQRQELEEKIDSKSNFRQKRNERQYSFNTKVLNLLERAKKLMKDDDKKSALYEIKEAIQVLQTQNEDILIADSSKFGWLTVSKFRGKEKLPSSIQKQIQKIDNNLDKYASKPNYKKGGHKNFRQTNSQSTVQTNRQTRKGPEETLQYLKTRKRSGLCTFCSETGHFWKECASYWSEVNKSRDKAD